MELDLHVHVALLDQAYPTTKCTEQNSTFKGKPLVLPDTKHARGWKEFSFRKFN
jgi:hypothetical protein